MELAVLGRIAGNKPQAILGAKLAGNLLVDGGNVGLEAREVCLAARVFGNGIQGIARLQVFAAPEPHRSRAARDVLAVPDSQKFEDADGVDGRIGGFHDFQHLIVGQLAECVATGDDRQDGFSSLNLLRAIDGESEGIVEIHFAESGHPQCVQRRPHFVTVLGEVL